MALRFTVHSLTGHSPFAVLTGDLPLLPSHILEDSEVIEDTEAAQGRPEDVERYVDW